MWLEVDSDLIIGIHNERCDSDYEWVEYEGDSEPNPGDKWDGKKVIAVEEDALTKSGEINAIAQAHIFDYYPTWKQLNIMRDGTKTATNKMSKFIDAVREWTHDKKPDLKKLDKIKP
jgi:hypothetical protein